MAIETPGVRNLHAAKNEFATRHERMNIITDADMYHAANLCAARQPTKQIMLAPPRRQSLGAGTFKQANQLN